MKDFFYKRGLAQAAADTGTAKVAAEPEMGEAMYGTISSATGDAGSERMRTNESPHHQANTHMDEHDRHVLRDPHNDAHVFPVGVQQSANTKMAVMRAMPPPSEESGPADLSDLIRRYGVNAAMAYPKVLESSPVPIVPHKGAKGAGGGAYIPSVHPEEGIHEPSIIMDPDNPNANILAHEIGHAQFQESPIGKFMQHPISRGAQFAAPIAAYAAGRYLPTNKLKALGVAASLGLTAPTLISEGVADYKGYQHLKGLKATDEELSEYVSDLVGPQATYLAMPAATLISGGGGHLMKGLAAQKAEQDSLKAILNKTGAYKLHARRKFRNLNISIENRKGSSRSWYDPHEDRHGSTVQKYPYGYIRMTEGMDGDHVDCYVGPHEKAKNVYVITTSKAPDFKKIDEQKCMLGFSSATAARKAFSQHYDDPRFFRSMKAMPYEEFERKVFATLHGKQKKVANVLAHIAGPSGSGKTTLGDRLSKQHPSLLVRDLDDFDDTASEKLFGDMRKRDYTDANIRTLAKERQRLMDSFIKKNKKKSIVFVGHHTEGDTVLDIPTNNRWMLHTSPQTSAYRAYLRSQNEKPDHRRTLEELPKDRREARDTIKELKALNYTKMSPKKIESFIAKAASNRFQSDDDRLIDNSPGTTHNQVPGDNLALPHSSLTGMRSIKGGNPEDPSDTIDRMFRFHDNPMSSRVLEGNTSALPASPGV